MLKRKKLYLEHEITYIKILKTFYKNIDLPSKNCVKRYVLSPFFQLAKDGDL